MTKVSFIQTDFTHGELTPELHVRSDLDIYRKAAKQLRNILIIPQGGAKRRFGLEYIAEFAANEDRYLIREFSYDDDAHYLLIFVDKKIIIYLNGFFHSEVTTVWSTDILTELKMTASGNLLVIVHADYPPYQLVIDPLIPEFKLTLISFKFYPVNEFKRNYDHISFFMDSVNIGENRLLMARNPLLGFAFDETYVGGIFNGIGFTDAGGVPRVGIARITEYLTPNDVKVTILQQFDKSFEIAARGKNCLLRQPAWSAEYGYPKTTSFYESRLWFGGSRSLPQNLFGSVINGFFNFDEGTGEADDAILVGIASNHIEHIKNIVGDRNLQIFCSNSEFVTGVNVDQKMSLDTISVRKQSANGSENIRPRVLDNQTIFVKKGGKIIANFIYDNTQDAYQALNISILSSHLIRNPVDMEIRKGSIEDDMDFLLVINSDGTLALYQTLREQKIAAWTLCDTVNVTNGKFKRVARVGNDIYFIIQRDINGTRRNYIEKLNFDIYTDSSIIKDLPVPSAIISNLEHLEGKIIEIVGDGYIFEPTKVVGGQVSISKEVSHVVAGLSYQPLIETLPIALQVGAGSTLYRKKTKVEVDVDFYNSVGIYVEDILIPFWKFQSFPYLPPEPITDFAEIPLLSGWERKQTLKISQKAPLPMTILVVSYNLEIS